MMERWLVIVIADRMFLDNCNLQKTTVLFEGANSANGWGLTKVTTSYYFAEKRKK